MTREQTDLLMDLLDTWYRWQSAYFPNLGASLPLYRAYDSGVIDEDEIDARYRKETAEKVEACMEYLTVAQRASVQVMMRNRTGPAVWHSRRVDPHIFQDALKTLYRSAKRQGLVQDTVEIA